MPLAHRGDRRLDLLKPRFPTEPGETILEVQELTKSFYGVAANDRVDFELRAGEVHGLLGENGAGKSTLCSVLAGLYRPDGGVVELDGQSIELRSPQDAMARGIGMVYQHFRLVPSLTVAENMILGQEDQGVRLALRSVEARVEEIADEYGLAVSPGSHIWQLSVGEQQRVEILKQLFRGARIMILDEPTAVLAPQECDKLFAVVEQMAGQGHAIVLVSHKMDEILTNTDRVTVLRHGRNAGTVPTSETDAARLATMMIGSEHAPESGRTGSRRFDDARPVLTVDDLRAMGDRGTPAVNGATLEVREGQIVGVAGVAGNGQRELQEAIAGLRPVTGGSVMLGDRDITSAGPRDRYRAGLAYVPEDRLGTGVARGLTLEENLVLKSYNEAPHARYGVLSPTAIAATADELAERFDVRGAHSNMPVSLMSGGNVQKAILARELTRSHEILLAASPTRGLDLAATATVRNHIRTETENGRGVLLFSEDLAEITEMSDLILVMSEGRIVGSYTPETLDIDELGLLMTGAKIHGQPNPTADDVSPPGETRSNPEGCP
ncbi:MAG: ABC transporter ATP-binding protein [Acidimicrobiales bacterium]